MKKIVMAVMALVLVFGGILYYVNSNNEGKKTLVEKYGLDQLDLRQMISTMEENTTERRYAASIYSDRIDVMDANGRESISTLDDVFYLSVAPFENQTHPCDIHSLTGCQGEMMNTEFDVVIKDINGTVVFDETVESYSNGFFGVWLPRDMKGTITVDYNGKSATADISTTEGSYTCLTTMQLA